MHRMHKYFIVLLVVSLPVFPTQSQRIYSFKNWATLRNANWSSLLFEPSAFVVKSHVRLRNRPEGYQPSPLCSRYVGMAYLDHIRDSKQTLCAPEQAVAKKKTYSSGKEGQGEPTLPASHSSVDCYTAPYVRVGAANKASISLCRSRNLVLNTCGFFTGRRKGTLNKKFPMPSQGAVQVGCDMVDYTQLAQNSSDLRWLKSIHDEVWWSNATRNNSAVARFCAAGSPTLVTTPTLFVMRDRHANYAHEMEVVSMAFSFLAAVEPEDVAGQGLQVVIVDQAPPTGFLETWARMSRPYRLRILAHDPYPPNTCFRSAYHVYTFAAGIGYNTNGETASCESPVTMGMSHWLRQLYDERDPLAPLLQQAAPMSAAVTAGPVAAAAGLRGMRAPTSGLVMKNVVWLSRRNLEMVRLLLNASAGWKSMRLVRNEDEVVAGILAAVQEWNSESCLIRRFERDVKKAYQESLNTVNAVHIGPGAESADALAAARRKATERVRQPHNKRKLNAAAGNGVHDVASNADVDLEPAPELDLNLGSGERQNGLRIVRGESGDGRRSAWQSQGDSSRRSQLVSKGDGGSDIDEHGNDEDDEEEGLDAREMDRSGQAGAGALFRSVPKNIDSAKAVHLEELWEDTKGMGNCRRTNVLFTFVDGDFNDMPYHQQLKIIFRTGVLVGVHGAGLTHGYFMPPGQSAVLQLLGDSFSKVAANNVFQNMAVGLGNFYEEVLYSGVDIKVSALKQAVKRAMDFVGTQVMDAQTKQQSGTLPPLVLDDQNHFSIVVPSPLQCPRNWTQEDSSRRSLGRDH